MDAIGGNFFLALMVLVFVSPLGAIAVASILFARHRDRVEPERRVPVIVYVLAIVVGGASGGFLGMIFGVERACHGPKAGNLCGLWGIFITGPLSAALVILLIGMAVASIRPGSRVTQG